MLLALLAARVAAGAGNSLHCGPDLLPPPPPKGKTKKDTALNYAGSGIRLRFDDARDVRADVATLDPAPGRALLLKGDDVKASMSAFLRSIDRTMFLGQKEPNARIDRFTDSGGIEVCVEIDAGAAAGVAPGEYASSVGVIGTDLVIGSTIPVVATFRASRWLAAGLALAGVVVGLIVKMLTDLAAARRQGTTPSAREYVRSVDFAAAVILGALGGWFGYAVIYDPDPTWGDSGADLLKLFGICFSFQLAGIGGIDLGRRMIGG